MSVPTHNLLFGVSPGTPIRTVATGYRRKPADPVNEQIGAVNMSRLRTR